MERLHYHILINASPSQVWHVLWNDATYPRWTAPFGPGGLAKTDWQEGSKVLFTDAAGHDGMVSSIARKKENEFLGFRHLGVLKNGVEDLDSPDVKGWSGAEENYTLRAVNGQTELLVDTDTTEEHSEFFKETWPQAMQLIKDLSEQK